MCGIYGILDLKGRSPDPDVVRQMGHAMRHRGPDGEGLYADRNVVLGMKRLAIIDVAGGDQPIFNEDESVVVVCNGEIYNFRELRSELEAAGHRFRTGSDCEVIVHLYEDHGDRCVEKLSGMFAFALWDKTRGRLLIARDRLGIKPLYVARHQDRLIFSSELKSILAIPGFARELNFDALPEFFALGYVPAPASMLAGIDKLEPGRLLIVEDRKVRTERYWRLPPAGSIETGEVDWPASIAETLEQAVVSQMVSDVPLGAFLSGGIDSSAVVAFMARNSERPVKTYSIGFDTDSGGKYYNELPYARRVAELFGTEHHEIVVRPDVTSLLPELLWQMDEPIADAAFITTYLVSKFARQDVTVILSGVGGDELFGGYRRYWSEYLAGHYRRIPALLRERILQPVARRLPSDRHSALLNWSRLAKGFLAGAELSADERYERFIRVFSPADIEALLGKKVESRSPALARAFDEASGDDSLRRLMDVDLLTQLPDDLLMLTDRMSMATSLECRVPLLDNRVLDLAARMPSGQKVRGTKLKFALKQALRGVLPDDIIDRKKRGFGAPIGAWFKDELSAYLDSVLCEQAVRDRGVFDWARIREMKEAHREQREDYTDHLLSLMNFELWCRLYLDGQDAGSLTETLQRAANG